MNERVRGVFSFLVLFLVAPLAAQQSPEKPPDKATIAGQVVKAATGEPLKKAWVALRKAEGRSERHTAITDASGRFTLKGIEPGRYRLWAARNGYVRQEYGQRDPSRPGTILTLAPGQNVRDVLFRLIPAAVIAGRVYDEDGEALPAVMVQALRYRYFRGKRRLTPSQTARTNDLGEFRLYGLAPGQYRISATYRPGLFGGFGVGQSASATRVTGSGADESYAPTYYPGTNDPSAASSVEVKTGDEFRGIDFMLLPTRTVRVRGRVFNAVTGRPGRDVMIWLMQRNTTVWTFSMNDRARVEQDGKFEIRGVTPGPYVLAANWWDEGMRYLTRIPVEVGSTDVTGIEVVIQRGPDLPGQLSVDGKEPGTASSSPTPTSAGEKRAAEDSLTDLRVSLQPRDDTPFWGNTGRVKDDGTFTLENVGQGDYRVSVWRLPPDYYLKQARLGGEDVLEEGLSVAGGRLPGRLEVLVSSAGGRIDGNVLTEEEKPFSGARVVLVPEKRRRDQRRLYKSTTTDQNGRFTLRGITPGEYKLFAWEKVEGGAYQDPEFLRPYEERGHKVRLEEGTRLSVGLELIPSEERPR